MTSTFISGAIGIIPGTSLVKPLNALKAAKKVEKGIRQVSPGLKSAKVKEAADGFLLSANLAAYSFSAGLEIPKFLPEFTIGNDCECE